MWGAPHFRVRSTLHPGDSLTHSTHIGRAWHRSRDLRLSCGMWDPALPVSELTSSWGAPRRVTKPLTPRFPTATNTPTKVKQVKA